MQTITRGHTNPPPPPVETIREVLAGLNVADHAMVAVRDPIAPDLGRCGACDPTGPAFVAVAVITWTTRFGRPNRVTTCALCVSTALNEALADGRDVIVRVAVGVFQ